MKNRLREIREARGMSQNDLAKMLDTSGVSISRYEKEDGRITLTLLAKLASALRCRPEDLIADGDIPSIVPIAVRDQDREIYFDGRELAAHGLDQTLEVVCMIDDSMAPTLARGDMALVDTKQRRIEGEGLYAFAVKGQTIIKRAALNLTGCKVAVTSDNPTYRDLGDFDCADLVVIGKVVHAFKRM
jgi:transcriptional regulator with XRE-family HTH domain